MQLELPLQTIFIIPTHRINHLQLNVSKMTDSQLLQELKSDPVLSSTFQNIIPQLDQTNDEVTEQLDGE